MRRRVNLVALAQCIAVLMILGGCAGQGSAQATATPGGVSPFADNWQSTDKDLSHQTLNISQSGSGFSILYDDDGATVCSGRPATASGNGAVASNALTVSLATACLNPTTPWGTAPYTFTYAQGTDTLTDNYTVVWHRVSQFVGYWQSTDKDASHQTAFITDNAGTLTVAYYDSVATVCGGKPASATGSGSPAGSALSVTFTVNCLNPTTPWGTAPYTFTYAQGTDTLTDNYTVVWHRVSPAQP